MPGAPIAIPVLLWLAALLAGIMPKPATAQQNATWQTTAVTNDFYSPGGNWSTGSAPTGTATFGISNITNLALFAPLYSSTNAYNAGDQVSLNGVRYVALLSNLNVAPGTNPSIWVSLPPVYSNATLYNAGDQVSLNGVNYLALQNALLGITPATNPALWSAFTGNGIGGFTFNPGASNYTFSLPTDTFTFAGAGIVVNGGSVSLVVDGGVLNFTGSSTAGSASITNSSTVNFNGNSTAGSATITTSSGGQTFFANSASGGTARLILNGSGIVDISRLTNGGTTAGSIEGAGTIFLGANNLAVGGNNLSTTFSGALQDGGTAGGIGGSLTKVGTGTLTLSGINTYTGATTVDGGVLNVSGAITGSSNVIVNGGTLNVTGSVSDPTVSAGGLLTGTGSVGNTTVNSGGMFTPGIADTAGTSMTVAGNLAFASGALYVVSVNPSTASFANVTGRATLGGATVDALFASGSYVSKSYTILAARGGVSGNFAPGVVNTNLPQNFKTSLSYDANDVVLNLTLNFTPPPGGGGGGAVAPNFGSGLSGNQQAVGNALINFFNTNGRIPLVYGSLTPAGLTQASGELATGSQQATFGAMSQFIGLLTDPFSARSGGPGTQSAATGFADEDQASAYAAKTRTDAFAFATKAPPLPVVQRWSVWAAGFGGTQSTDGNAILGSNSTTSSIFGTAVGADYLFSSNTLLGIALAGGATGFSVTNGGTGRSDLFQAGAYLRHYEGPAYVAAGLAYGWQDITTDRSVTIAGLDHLHAEFNANAYSGRVEGGYRFATPWIGLAPYGAAQFTTFDLPTYAEQVIFGTNNFALAYGAKSVTDPRSELGVRTDKSFAMANGVLTLRGRAAWAHDFASDRSIAATFQALPGASFVVNGAAQARDSALTTASAEMSWLNGWSAAATFEGEFSNVTRSYAGKGVLRYAW